MFKKYSKMDKIQILLKNANLNQKFEKIFKKLTSKIAKPSDLMFYFSIFVLWNIPIVILKNYHHDVKRVMNNYLPGLTFLIVIFYSLRLQLMKKCVGHPLH